MNFKSLKRSKKKYDDRFRKSRWVKVVSILASIVLFATVYLLILPAITSESKTICEQEEHQHNNSCFTLEETLTCKQEEHQHTDTCFAEIAGDTNADVETKVEWENSFASVRLKDNWDENIVAIAQTQIGYQESSLNYVTRESGEQKGYTRYGEWHGESYEDWDALFAAFCIRYAGIEDYPIESDCSQWVDLLSRNEENLYIESRFHTPLPGELAFFDRDKDLRADHVGIVTEVLTDDAGALVQLKTIEGNVEGSVKAVSYNQEEIDSIGYGILPKNPKVEERQERSIPARDDTNAMPLASSTSLTVKKEWNDNETSHDPVMVTLMRTGTGGLAESTGSTLTLSEDNHWEGVFDNLEIPADGQKFAYSVKEETVSGYATSYGEIKTISGSTGGTGGEPSVDSHWVPSLDTKLISGKTYVFRVKGTEHVLVHHKDDTDDKNLTRASVTVIPGANRPKDDILTNVPLSAPWTVSYKVQDKGPGFIFYNGHNGDHYIQGDTWLPKEEDAAVNAYTPSDGRIQNVDKEEYLCWQADEDQYYLQKDEDDYSARLEKFDLYELGSSPDTYEIVITNTPGQPQPETSTSLIVKKEWSDSDGHDSVVVTLMRTGAGGLVESTGRTLTLSADNNWEGVFDNLEIPTDGQKFAYSVKEESVPGYTTSYSEVKKIAGSYWVPSSGNELAEGKNYVFLVKGTNYVLDHTRGETMKRGTATIGLDGSLMDVPSTAIWTAGSNTILYHTLGGTTYYMAEDKMTPKISEATGKTYTSKGYLGDRTKGGEYHYWSLGDNKYGIDENKDDSISEIFGLYEMGGETGAYQVVITNEKDTPTSTTTLSVKKEWGDPEKVHAPVVMTLMRMDPDGKTYSTGRTLTLSDDNNWEGVFDNLSIPAEGENFPYFVQEEEIADYITSYGDIESLSGTSWEKSTELVEGKDYVFLVKNKPFVLNHTSGEALRRGDVTIGSDGSLSNIPSTAIWTAGKNKKGHIILYHTLGGTTYYMAEDKMTSKMSEATGKTYTSKGYLGDRTKGGEYLYWDKSLYGIDEDKDDSVSEIFNLYTMTSSSDSYKTVIKNIPVDPQPGEKPKIHKTIDYLGDGGSNPDTALVGEDFYRLYLDILGSVQPVQIYDELSAYVAYHRDQSDLKVIRTDKNGTITTIWENGAPTASNVDADGTSIVQQVLYEPSNAQYSTGKVRVMFDSECQLDDENSFSLSFNVKITDYAKEQAVEKGYNSVGDADTDYGNNQTSSGMPGFRSNNNAYITYISQGMGYRIEYPHPVIQTGGAKLQIDKVNTTGDTPLPNAVFNLYRNAKKNDEGAVLIPTLSNIFGIKINPDPIVTDSEGSTTPITLAPGRYYLTEIEAPAGYRILNKPIAFDISPEGMVVLVTGESFADVARIQEIEGSDVLSLVVYNTAAVALPETGGPGTMPFMICGLALIAGCFSYRCYMRHKSERRLGS